MTEKTAQGIALGRIFPGSIFIRQGAQKAKGLAPHAQTSQQ
jgi:uncharacterized membrane protein YphA (DoxX/SURF4 family)